MDDADECLQDFQAALQEGGPSEALLVLRSYRTLLKTCGLEALGKLHSVFQAELTRSLSSAEELFTEEEWAAFARLRTFLQQLDTPDGLAAHSLQDSWNVALGQVLCGSAPIPRPAHLRRVAAMRLWMSDALKGAATLYGGDAALQGRAGFLNHHPLSLSTVGALYLRLAHPDCMSVAQVRTLLEAAQPHWSLQAKWTVTHQMFQDVVRMLQEAPNIEAWMADTPAAERKASLQRVWDCLKLTMHGSPEATDEFWGTFGSTLLQLLAWAGQSGGTLLKELSDPHSRLRAMLDVLCNAESAAMVLRYTLTHPQYGSAVDNQKGAATALELVQALLRKEPVAVMAACAECLIDHSMPLPARMQSLHVMTRVQEEGSSMPAEQMYAELRQPRVLQSLLYVLSRDPSKRIRRQAMKLLSHATLSQGSPQAQEVLLAVCERARDKDVAVRQGAFRLLLEYPIEQLDCALSPASWRCLLAFGLTSEDADRAPAAVAQSPALQVRACAKTLFGRYLHENQAGTNSGAWVKNLQALLAAQCAHDHGGHQAVKAAFGSALQGCLTIDQIALMLEDQH